MTNLDLRTLAIRNLVGILNSPHEDAAIRCKAAEVLLVALETARNTPEKYARLLPDAVEEDGA